MKSVALVRGVALGFALASAAFPAVAAEPDGLILPPGFHAEVVAEGLGAVRHLAIRDNGDIYLSTTGKGTSGIIALHLGPDHRADQVSHFSDISGGTGIAIAKGALYAASPAAIYRFRFAGDALVPTAAPEVVIDGFPAEGAPNRVLALDGKGNLYVAIGGLGNICTGPVAAGEKPVGLKPCPSLTGHSGIWRFDASASGQKFSGGEQIATGIREITTMDWSPQEGALYAAMHGRDGTHATWPDLISQADDDNIGDELHRIVKGSDLGWPYTYYDGGRGVRLVSPEYGGDGKTAAPDGLYSTPVLSFRPGRAVPVDLVFYRAKAFPAAYRGGAFFALHGSGGPLLPEGRNGYTIAFLPIGKDGKAGALTTFADGFAGPSPADKNSGHAKYRPVGEAVGPDGALYVADSQVGRIWRISYTGKD